MVDDLTVSPHVGRPGRRPWPLPPPPWARALAAAFDRPEIPPACRARLRRVAERLTRRSPDRAPQANPEG